MARANDAYAGGLIDFRKELEAAKAESSPDDAQVLEGIKTVPATWGPVGIVSLLLVVEPPLLGGAASEPLAAAASPGRDGLSPQPAERVIRPAARRAAPMAFTRLLRTAYSSPSWDTCAYS
jgi:hypothetical protein